MIGMSRTKLYNCLVVGIVGCFFICHALLVCHVSAKSTLAPGDELAREEDYLESPNKNFRLNFEVRPGSTSTTYTCFLCIQWTKYPIPSNSEQTTVWVAWVGQTQTSFIPKLTMEVEGRLVIHAENETVVNHDQQYPYVMNTTATLLDTGNLVLRGGGRTLWQSFDHPTANTWIPGMKIGRFGGLKTRKIQRRCLSSWTSEENPLPGDFSLCVDPNNAKQLVGMRGGSVYWHSGVWSSAESYFPFLVVRSHLRYFDNDNESYFAWDGTGTGMGTGMDFNVIKILANGEINVHLEGNIRSYVNCDHNYTYYFNQGCVKTGTLR
nr:G-type lectin S-receptor-like serine/threonine-protein kinase At1g67520 [Ipomoea batatas]